MSTTAPEPALTPFELLERWLAHRETMLERDRQPSAGTGQSARSTQ